MDLDPTVLSSTLGGSSRWQKDHFGSMVPDISGYSFRSPKRNDSTHILDAIDVGAKVNSSSSAKAEILPTVSALAETKGKSPDWEISGRRRVATNSHWQVDAIGRTALVGPYTGAPSGACTHRKNESDHVAGLIAPGHDVIGAPSNWVVQDAGVTKTVSPTRPSGTRRGSPRATETWLSPKKTERKTSPLKPQNPAVDKVVSTWGIKAAEKPPGDHMRPELHATSMFKTIPIPNMASKSFGNGTLGCAGKEYVDKVEARYGDSMKNWDIPGFLRNESSAPNSIAAAKSSANESNPGGGKEKWTPKWTPQGLYVTQEKKHLQQQFRAQKKIKEEPLMEWARGELGRGTRKYGSRS